MQNIIKNRIGFCCIVLGKNPSKFRSTTVTWCKNNPESFQEKLETITSHNLLELIKVINFCIDKKIWLYRISSNLIPLPDHDIGENIWLNSVNKFPDIWNHVKQKVQEYLKLGGRLTIHPSQYISISSPKSDVVKNSIKNLEYHGLLFDRLGLPRNHFALINIHISNGKLGQNCVETVLESLCKLSDSVTKRLTFENEDKSFWTVENIAAYFAIPIVFDTLHYSCNVGNISADLAHKISSESWKTFAPNIKQLCHHSEGVSGPTDRRHSDYITYIPDLNCDVEVESKMKNLSIENFL